MNALSGLRRLTPGLLTLAFLCLAGSAEESPDIRLNEKEEVYRLFEKAKDPDPSRRVEAYMQLIQRFSDTVYLAQQGPNEGVRLGKWGLGVYRATPERVSEELQTLLQDLEKAPDPRVNRMSLLCLKWEAQFTAGLRAEATATFLEIERSLANSAIGKARFDGKEGAEALNLMKARLAELGLTPAGASTPPAPEVPDEVRRQVENSIGQLDDESFEARQAAQKNLVTLRAKWPELVVRRLKEVAAGETVPPETKTAAARIAFALDEVSAPPLKTLTFKWRRPRADLFKPPAVEADPDLERAALWIRRFVVPEAPGDGDPWESARSLAALGLMADPASSNTAVNWEWIGRARFAPGPARLGGALYAMAQSVEEGQPMAWMACFNEETGKLLWKKSICTVPPLAFPKEAQPPPPGLPVLAFGECVYGVTNAGAVACLQAATGSVRWIRLYRRANEFNSKRGLWEVNAPLLLDGRLIVAPQDSDMLYAFDIGSGSRKWETERVSEFGIGNEEMGERLSLVHGVVNGRLAVSGRDLLFIRFEGGGRECHVPVRDKCRIAGRGVVTQHEVWLPQNEGIMVVNADLHPLSRATIGKLKVLLKWDDPKRDAGSLYFVNGTLYSISPTHWAAYGVGE